MNCKLEEKSRLCDALFRLEKGYITGNFESFFPFLAQDCVMESHWVRTPNIGYEAVTAYFTGKGKTLAKSGNFPCCAFVELLGICNQTDNVSVRQNEEETEVSSLSLMFAHGKPCLELIQKIDGKENTVLVNITLNESGFVKRINLCMPELFKYRSFYSFVDFYPVDDELYEENDDYDISEHLIRISEKYIQFLYCFIDCNDEYSYGYGELHIPMKNWLDILASWRLIIFAENFDDAFEKIAGVDYNSGIIQNRDIAKQLGKYGKSMWEDRDNFRYISEELIEWTELYKDKYTYINASY